jgi:hypothetical protein
LTGLSIILLNDYNKDEFIAMMLQRNSDATLEISSDDTSIYMFSKNFNAYYKMINVE